MGSRKILGLDFDGTLCCMAYPSIGKQKWPHKLILCLAEWLQQERDWIIILNTCRTGKYLDDAKNWLGDMGFVPDYCNEHPPELIEQFTLESRKISADLYIDDKNIGLIGWILRRF